MEQDILNNLVIVNVTISPNVRPIDFKYHIKWEENIIKEIESDKFTFYCLNMKIAVKKVSYLQSVHSNEYFSEIIIKSS